MAQVEGRPLFQPGRRGRRVSAAEDGVRRASWAPHPKQESTGRPRGSRLYHGASRIDVGSPTNRKGRTNQTVTPGIGRSKYRAEVRGVDCGGSVGRLDHGHHEPRGTAKAHPVEQGLRGVPGLSQEEPPRIVSRLCKVRKGTGRISCTFGPGGRPCTVSLPECWASRAPAR